MTIANCLQLLFSKFYSHRVHVPLKVIYVARNIKDATVSHFYHKRITSGCNDFKAFAKCSLNHETEYNPFIPHILEAWSQRDHPNLFFTTYEDMKADLRKVASGVLGFLKGSGKLVIQQKLFIRSNMIFEILLKNVRGYQILVNSFQMQLLIWKPY